MMMKKMAIIDLGSNSVRINIMSINACGGYTIVDSAKESVRLSEGLYESQMIHKNALERTIKVLHYFKGLAETYAVESIHALFTGARLAKNRAWFMERINKETALGFISISGEKEAYYTYLGVINSMACEDCVLIDIDGGSTELMWVKDRALHKSVSLPIGSIMLREMFSDISKKKKRIQSALNYVQEQLEKVEWLGDVKRYPIIGVGGTIRALGRMDKSINKYPIRNIHNYHLTTGELDFLFDKIFVKADGKEGDIEGIHAERADHISMGIIPLYSLIHIIESKEMRISGNGLRNGYFYELYFKERGQDLIVEDVLEHSCQNLIKCFDINMTHSRQVKTLALSLFDQLSESHDFNEKDRKALEVAALLHDVGMSIGYYDHHLHGMYLLMYKRLNGLRIKEHLKVGFLVGNHRIDGIEDILNDYRSMFSKKEIQSIQGLSVFLQIAEQLDRTMSGKVERLEVEFIDSHIMINLFGKEIPTIEIEAAKGFNEKFIKTFGRPYHLQYKELS